MYIPGTKKTLLFGAKADSTTEIKLGTVALDLKECLGGVLIAGGFPIFDSIQKNELGGVVRLAVRTGMPYDPLAKSKGKGKGTDEDDGTHEASLETTTTTTVDSMKPYEAFSFSSP